ncbi:MAG: hypothetical protein D6737_15580 [Chloroflexi bacterium]|nr:MAG: hypothetical protein D6737_15580 [Chloroflexota bacterium]
MTHTPSHTPSPTATRSIEAQLGLNPLSDAGHGMPPDATLRIIAADDTVTPNGTPVEPRTTFAAGIDRIYFFISFAGMQDGLLWSAILFRDNEPVVGQTQTWDTGDEGSSFFFLDGQPIFQPGAYEARLYVGDEQVDSFDFLIESNDN